jgi:hypothetical protein
MKCKVMDMEVNFHVVTDSRYRYEDINLLTFIHRQGRGCTHFLHSSAWTREECSALMRLRILPKIPSMISYAQHSHHYLDLFDDISNCGLKQEMNLLFSLCLELLYCHNGSCIISVCCREMTEYSIEFERNVRALVYVLVFLTIAVRESRLRWTVYQSADCWYLYFAIYNITTANCARWRLIGCS